MYRIGEFSMLSKTTVKALRYYESEKLLIPFFVDQETGYRFYETNQLLEIAKIISLKQIGLSIDKIKQILNGQDLQTILEEQHKKTKEEISILNNQLLRINFLLEEKEMKYEVVQKTLPDYIVYYKEGRLSGFDKITEFILSSSSECLKTNPNMKCVEPDYCYVNYLDGEYREENLLVRYAQAVTESGKENETIKFMKLKSVEAVCIYHKGSYSNLREAYSFIMKYIDEHNLKMIESPRERYIDGIWNNENPEDWLTEIQVPVIKK